MSGEESSQDQGDAGSQMGQVKAPGGVKALEDKLLGPSYDYAGQIHSPDEMGMSSAGNFGALSDDIKGILGYIDLLISGHCELGKCASKTGGPLGNKFFLDTAVKCTDKASGNEVTRSIYINNVPDGTIPFISNMGDGVSFDKFQGLVPGIMSNVAQIHPMQILTAFTTGASPTCQAVTMPTVDAVTNAVGSDTRYIMNGDIDMMNKSWFPDVDGQRKGDYDTSDDNKAGFCNRADVYGASSKSGLNPASLRGVSLKNSIDYSNMPNDIVIKFYFSILGLLGMYILLRLMLRKK